MMYGNRLITLFCELNLSSDCSFILKGESKHED